MLEGDLVDNDCWALGEFLVFLATLTFLRLFVFCVQLK